MSRKAMPAMYRQILTVDAARAVLLEMLPEGCGLTVNRVMIDEPLGRGSWFHKVSYSAQAGRPTRHRIEIEAPTPAELVQQFVEQVLPKLQADAWVSGPRFADELILPLRAIGE